MAAAVIRARRGAMKITNRHLRRALKERAKIAPPKPDTLRNVVYLVLVLVALWLTMLAMFGWPK